MKPTNIYEMRMPVRDFIYNYQVEHFLAPVAGIVSQDLAIIMRCQHHQGFLGIYVYTGSPQAAAERFYLIKAFDCRSSCTFLRAFF